MGSASGFEAMLADALYTIVAIAVAYTGYGIFDRYVSRNEQRDFYESLKEAHRAKTVVHVQKDAEKSQEEAAKK